MYAREECDPYHVSIKKRGVVDEDEEDDSHHNLVETWQRECSKVASVCVEGRQCVWKHGEHAGWIECVRGGAIEWCAER